MLITGYRAGVNTISATRAISKHTGMSIIEAKKLIEDAIEGKTVKLPDDFVLREDLEDLGFKID